MLEREEELSSKKNPLQIVWRDFKVEIIGKRIDIGSIEDVLRANNITQ